jgi:hypothetical protein
MWHVPSMSESAAAVATHRSVTHQMSMPRALLATLLASALALFSPTFADASGSHGSSGGHGSANSGSSKPVHVKGYAKKDGTVVEAHDRNAPGSGAETPHVSLADLAHAGAERRATAQSVPVLANVGTRISTAPIHIVTDPVTGRKTITNDPITPLAAAAPRPTSPTVLRTALATGPSASSIGIARDERGRIQRSAAARHAFARQTGYPGGRPGYVVDHIKPLACGGADAPSNMQWQTVAEGKAKDKIERVGC